jgi:hypothetical protein
MPPILDLNIQHEEDVVTVRPRAARWWPRDPAFAAGTLYRDFNRGRDDGTVVVARITNP